MDVVQIKVVAAVVTNHVVWEDVALFVIVVVLKVDVAFRNGCFACPNFEKILLDVRFLNSIQEALTINAGLYVSTLFTPYDCCGFSPKYFGYKKMWPKIRYRK